jgi:hypothetical protein
MNVFGLRHALVGDYSGNISSFIQIRDKRTRASVDPGIELASLWSDPLKPG